MTGIKKIETHEIMSAGFTGMTADTGDCGWGQTSTGNTDIPAFSIEGKDDYPWRQEFYVEDRYTIEAGHATVTDQPGWGVEIDSGWLGNAEHKASPL